MERATNRIEQHLEDERQALRSNLQELEDRVRATLDWRRQFRSNTSVSLGLALGGGLLIGLMTKRRTAVPAEIECPTRPVAEPAARSSDHRRRELSLAWRSIESALIGVAAAKLKDTLAHMLPGFQDEIARREAESYPRHGSARYRS